MGWLSVRRELRKRPFLTHDGASPAVSGSIFENDGGEVWSRSRKFLKIQIFFYPSRLAFYVIDLISPASTTRPKPIVIFYAYADGAELTGRLECD